MTSEEQDLQGQMDELMYLTLKLRKGDNQNIKDDYIV